MSWKSLVKNILTSYQRFKKNDDGGILSCKMHDMVNDFAQHFLGKNECFTVETNSREKSLKSCPDLN